MQYREAMEHAFGLKYVSRPHWTDNKMVTNGIDLGLVVYSDNREPVRYVPTNEDLTADDWELLNSPKKVKPIEPSMTVSLISGGPIMTVISITPESVLGFSSSRRSTGDLAACKWFDKLDQLHSGDFFTSTLTPVSGLK